MALAAAALVILRRPTEVPAAVWRQLTFTGDTRLAAISPDGESIAYTTRGAGQAHVLVREVQGAAADTIASLAAAYTLEWSPDGTRLLVGGHRQAVVISRYGGTMRRIEAASRFPAYVLAHWLPDGLRVSLHSYASKQVRIVNLETEDTFPLPIDGTYEWMEEGAWSPTGTQFAVGTQSISPARWTIRVVPIGGRSHTLLEDSMPIGTPRWSQDGTALYFTRGEYAVERIAIAGRKRGAVERIQANVEALPGGASEIGRTSITRDERRAVFVRGTRFSNLMLIDADRRSPTGEIPLTTGTSQRWSPVVSPDGKWLAFGQAALGGSELARMPSAGGPVESITQGANVYPNGRIAWSALGDEVAFTSARAEGVQIVVANVHTGRLRPYPQARVSEGSWSLSWSPGTRIAYQRPGNSAIHLLDPESGFDHALIIDSGGFFHAPAFSPDGRELAITWNRGGGDQSIWLLDLTDSARRRIQDSARTGTTTGGPYAIGWSPDGRYVLATLGRSIIRLFMPRSFSMLAFSIPVDLFHPK
jgi:Tol biopolymer transport system component